MDIISMAQQAKPNDMGQMEFLRAQLTALSRVVMTRPSEAAAAALATNSLSRRAKSSGGPLAKGASISLFYSVRDGGGGGVVPENLRRPSCHPACIHKVPENSAPCCPLEKIVPKSFVTIFPFNIFDDANIVLLEFPFLSSHLKSTSSSESNLTSYPPRGQNEIPRRRCGTSNPGCHSLASAFFRKSRLSNTRVTLRALESLPVLRVALKRRGKSTWPHKSLTEVSSACGVPGWHR